MDMRQLMDSLARERPVFHSEADFQFALGWEIKGQTGLDVRLEFPPFSNESLYLDIWLPSDRIAIELKYLTRKLRLRLGDESFALRDQSAQDIRRYDFVKDIERLERVVKDGNAASGGMAVLVTNDPSYWKPPARPEPIDAAFRVDQGRKLSGEMRWSDRAGKGTTKGRECPILLSGSYLLEWREYGGSVTRRAKEKYAQFRYLAVEVGR